VTFSPELQGPAPHTGNSHTQRSVECLPEEPGSNLHQIPDAADSPLNLVYSGGQALNLTMDDLALLGLDRSCTVQLLQWCCSHTNQAGIFCILAPWHEALRSVELQLQVESAVTRHHPLSSLVCALLATALQAEADTGPSLSGGARELLIDTLRVQALQSIPILTWKSRALNLDQVLVLLLLSYTWCWKESLSEISSRWVSLARVIWQDLQHYDQNLETLSRVKNSL
jgi:hypothetical protein